MLPVKASELLVVGAGGTCSAFYSCCCCSHEKMRKKILLAACDRRFHCSASYESKPLNCWLAELGGPALLCMLRLFAATRDCGEWVASGWAPAPARLPLLLLLLELMPGALEPSLTCRALASAAACLAAACKHIQVAETETVRTSSAMLLRWKRHQHPQHSQIKIKST